MIKALEHVEIPGEREARDRAWAVVSSAFRDRLPGRRRARRAAPAVAIVCAAAVAAAALTQPGRALVHSIRETIGVRRAQPALFSVPGGGRLLVSSTGGVWVVRADGSKRRLGSYTSASWSPQGLYALATGRDGLFALTQAGEERWSLARPRAGFARWTGTRTDTEIAYLSGSRLRIVAGDGTGDHPGCGGRIAAVAPAWRPGADRSLAVASLDGGVLVYRSGTCSLLWRARTGGRPTKLEWSSDGRLLLAFAPQGLRVYDARGRVVAQDDPSDGTRDADAVFLPGTGRIAVIRVHGAQSDVFLLGSGKVVFRGTGAFTQLAPSPDGRRLLVAWPTADQWVFVPVGRGRIRAVGNISAQFRSQTFPHIDGWAP